MVRNCFKVLLPLAVFGCLDPRPVTPLVQTNPFETTSVSTPRHLSASPASTEAAARVDALGRKLLAANPQLGVKPVFRTIGAPQLEIFHNGTTDIVITEGMVRQCAAEERLAAVLCQELGKMIAEREALATPQTRCPEREPPMEVRVGNDYGAGSFGSPDETHRAEQVKYGNRDRRRVCPPPPDPGLLARLYLSNAGYQPTDLDAVLPMLASAEGNGSFEKLMRPK